jgi:diaminopimelate decarboxylase
MTQPFTLKPWMPLTMNRDAQGSLTLAGLSLDTIAQTYQTPVYLIDEQTIREQCRQLWRAVKKHYPGDSRIFYAAKALCNTAVLKIIETEGFGVDVASIGEALTALAAGIHPRAITFQGNNKSQVELEFILEHEIGRIQVDNLDELDRLQQLCITLDKTANILLRISPGVEAHTHEFIMTGQEDSKFGLDIKSGALDLAIQKLKNLSHLNFWGVSAHIGSQILDPEAFTLEAKVLVDLLLKLQAEHDIIIKELNIGGGFGVSHLNSEVAPTFSEAIAGACQKIHRSLSVANYPIPRLILEPGRSIVARAGVTLYTTGDQKRIPGLRHWVSVDGGMGDNPRFALYQAPYTAELTQLKTGPKTKVALVGRYCESGDVLIPELELPPVKSGDRLVVYSTGAYNYTMASRYNRVGIPGMLLLKNSQANWIVKPEPPSSLLDNDLLPDYLCDTQTTREVTTVEQ